VQDVGGVSVPVDEAAISRARCDATVIDLSHVGRPNKQPVPPHTRALVQARDHHRCRVPGCRNWIWVDVHHLIPRELGGSNDPDNLILLCGTHHDLHHQHRLRILGTRQAAVVFQHPTGWHVSAAAVT